MIADWMSAMTKGHLNGLLILKLSWMTWVPYVEMGVPFAGII